MPARFLLVDDHPLFLEALQVAVQAAYPDAEIVEATSIAEAKAAVAKHGRFDLALLDLSMPGVSGFDGLIELRTRFPKLPVVIVSALEDSKVIHGVLSYGASGFIPKSARKAELADALRDVMAGSVTLPRSYRPPEARSADMPDANLAARLLSLTPQQLRVLQMLRLGMLNKQIAHELDVGETTVKAHVSEILRKLAVASRTQAVIEVSKIDFGPLLAGRGSDSQRLTPQ